MDEPRPVWLSNDFLTHCLQSEEGKQHAVITKFTTSFAVPPGHNYGSCVFRVKVEYKDGSDDNNLQTISLIMKSKLSEGLIQEIFDIPVINEYMFYKKFLPEASKFTDVSFAPKSFFSSNPLIIILEDLTDHGFIMANRMEQLDFRHCHLYMVSAASMHAAFIAVIKERPELIEDIGAEKLFSNDVASGTLCKNMIISACQRLANYSVKSSKLFKYGKIIKDISPAIWDMIVEAHMSRGSVNTINQGDPWVMNMMFKHDKNGTVSKVKLIDFQLLRYASPVNDLIFFIWSSTNHDVRHNWLDKLYQVYLDAFNQKLEEFNCIERLTFENFMTDMEKMTPTIIFMAVAVFPLLCNPDPVDFVALFQNEGTENPYAKYYDDNYCNNHLPKVLEEMELAGVFHYIEKHKQV